MNPGQHLGSLVNFLPPSTGLGRHEAGLQIILARRHPSEAREGGSGLLPKVGSSLGAVSHGKSLTVCPPANMGPVDQRAWPCGEGSEAEFRESGGNTPGPPRKR